jgi:hypothetical protein
MKMEMKLKIALATCVAESRISGCHEKARAGHLYLSLETASETFLEHINNEYDEIAAAMLPQRLWATRCTRSKFLPQKVLF